jgi:hypothetical protein
MFALDVSQINWRTTGRASTDGGHVTLATETIKQGYGR